LVKKLLLLLLSGVSDAIVVVVASGVVDDVASGGIDDYANIGTIFNGGGLP
jgi:hypothetical protein